VLEITPIPAFDDNYIWLLRRNGSPWAAAVDPGDPAPLRRALQQRSLRLGCLLITHHHWDHAGGIDDLVAAYPECPVYGPCDSRIPGITHPRSDGMEVQVPGLDCRLRVLAVPGHTSSHIAFLGESALFCGDTLFAAGCGRVFDGTFDQLSASLQRLASLPAETAVYCAHEYTLANLGFARWVEPDNPEIERREVHERRRRADGMPTLPSTLGLELATNPFLRTRVPSVIDAAQRYAQRQLATPAEVFRVLRQWKDREYD
jgi:hydroxyacylglutathione hydrolase